MRKLLTILMLTISLSMSATSKDTLNAVTMVSYEQGWLDSEGTLALKNNTNEDIFNVTYRITYLDMNGNPLDYEEYTSEIDVAPGMTKKVNIPAYERERGYSYYNSETSLTRPHRFKIKFEVQAYNTPDAENDLQDYGSSQKSDVHNDISIIICLIVVLLAFGAYVGLYVLVAVMANRRNRNAALWVLVSIFATPLLAIILLLCLGNQYNPDDNMHG